MSVCGEYVYNINGKPTSVKNCIFLFNKSPQAKCPPTFEMSVCGEYVYNINGKPTSVKNCIFLFNKSPQAKCPPTFEMSVCSEYVYNINAINDFYNPSDRLFFFNFPICCKEQFTEKSDLQNNK